MSNLQHLIKNNRIWAEDEKKHDVGIFEKAELGQKPRYLWIGCVDSRVPAERVLGLNIGEILVHRNIANCLSHDDINAMSVLTFAVKHLQVSDVIVCGHYACGGCQVALGNEDLGVIDKWLVNIRQVIARKKEELNSISDFKERADRLAEINAKSQAINVCKSQPVQEAWAKGQEVAIHAWIFDIRTGHIKDLSFCINKPDDIETVCREHDLT